MNLYSTNYPAVYRGVVVDINDPKNLGRCRVRVPSIHGDQSIDIELLPWARPITVYPISKGKGNINIPDVGDIVWVMFEASRKEYPVYFGGTYGVNDMSIGTNIVDIYIEDGNRITYDRTNRSYTLNVGDHGIVINNSGVSIFGNIRIKGDVEVEGKLYTDLPDNGESMEIVPVIVGEENSPNASTSVAENNDPHLSAAIGNPGTADFDEKSLKVTGGVGINRLSDSESFCNSLVKTIGVTCRDENGNDYEKKLTINKYLEDNVKSIFEDIYNKTDFCIRKSDTGAYNYRKISGKSKLSYHSYGVAIDLNWNLNPYSSSAGGSDDNLRLRSMDHPVVKIFQSHGWGWGGSYHDLMHFSYFNGY